MKRTARRPAKMIATGVVALGAAMTLSGCVLASPAVTTRPYPAGDGFNGSITDPASNSTIKLNNFFVVTQGKGQPGSLIGGVVNTGTAGVLVDIAVADGSQAVGEASVTAAPGKLVQIGPNGTQLTVSSVPKAPGSLLTLVARTKGGGSIKFSVPVLAADSEEEFATLLPTPTPSATPSSSASSPASSSASSSSASSVSPTS